VTAITIHPSRIRSFGASDDVRFFLVTNRLAADWFAIEPTHAYASAELLVSDSVDDFEELLLHAIPRRAHVLVISPGEIFHSPPPSTLGDRKLIAMPCYSTPTPPEAIRRFMEVIEETDPLLHERVANRILSDFARHPSLRFVDRNTAAVAAFDHHSGACRWYQQAGPIDWGEQQIGPAGKISAVPGDIMQHDPHARLPINGELALRGQPIVHCSSSALRADQQRLYQALTAIGRHALMARVEDGEIARLRVTDSGAARAAAALEALFAEDARYRVLWEIGLGINTRSILHPSNMSMNEVYGGANGVCHFGLGLMPDTTYALAFICPDTSITGFDGEILFGAQLSANQREVTLQ